MGWNEAKGSEGAWLIKNSWGTGWGKNGYMWITYGSNNIGYAAAWVDARKFISSTPVNPEPIPPTPPVYPEPTPPTLPDTPSPDSNCPPGQPSWRCR